MQEGLSAQVVHGVTGVIRAAGQGGVADIYGVIAFLGNVRPPEGLRLALSRFGGGDHAGGTHLEGVVHAGIALFGIGKTGADRLPIAFFLV